MRVRICVVGRGETEWIETLDAVAPLRYPIHATRPQLFVTLRREPAREGDRCPRDVFFESDGKCVWVADTEEWPGFWGGGHVDKSVAFLRYEAYGLYQEFDQFVVVDREPPNLENLSLCVVTPVVGTEWAKTGGVTKDYVERKMRMSRSCYDYKLQGSDLELPITSDRVDLYRGGVKIASLESPLLAAAHVHDYLSVVGRVSRKTMEQPELVDVPELHARLLATLRSGGYPYRPTYGYHLIRSL